MKGKPGASISLIFSESTKTTGKLNVPNLTGESVSTVDMHSHHVYCGVIWDLMNLYLKQRPRIEVLPPPYLLDQERNVCY